MYVYMTHKCNVKIDISNLIYIHFDHICTFSPLVLLLSIFPLYIFTQHTHTIHSPLVIC